MTPQNCYFEVRWTTEIAGMPFHTTMEAQSYSELVHLARELQDSSSAKALEEPISITAAEFCFDTKNKSTDSYECLDDGYSEMLEFIVKETLTEGPCPLQHYMNARMGGYDKFNNRILPVDLGITFPDGTVRLYWDQSESKLGFDEAYDFYSKVLSTLLAMARTPYFQETDEEIDEGNVDAYKKRRTDFLFEHGLWPDTDSSFEDASSLEAISTAMTKLMLAEPV